MRLSAELAFGTHFARHARHFTGKRVQLIHHGVDGVLQFQNFTFNVGSNFPGKVAARHGGGHFGNVTHLRREVGTHGVDRVGQIFPGTGHVAHLRLPTQLAFGTYFTRHARNFKSESVKLIYHGVERVLQFENFALYVHRNFFRQVTARHCCRHRCDVTHLAGEVGRHRVDVIGQIFPRTRYARHHRLPTERTLGADLTRHAAHLKGEAVQLVHHGIDGIFQFQNFAAHRHGNFLRQVTIRHRRGHLGNVTYLRREVGRHRIDRIGQPFPRSGYTGHFSLTTELAFGTHFARDARHLGREAIQLVHHGVDSFFQLQNFALHIHGNLA